MERGRPTDYTPELCDKICSRIAVGKSARKTCIELGIGLETVFGWLRTRPDFAEQYAKAKDDSADAHAEKIQDAAEQEPERGPDGKIDPGDVAHRRLLIDTLKWTASKLKPKKYGERIMAEHSGPGGTPIQVITSVPSAESANDDNSMGSVTVPDGSH